MADVERDLRRLTGENKAKILFPAITLSGSFHKDNPYANYVFVSSTMTDSQLLKLEKSRFVDCVLCIPGSAGRWRQVSKLSDADLVGMRPAEHRVLGEEELKIGDEVRVTTGEWQGLQGSLQYCFGSQVKVLIQLRSKRRLLVLTRQEIEKVN